MNFLLIHRRLSVTDLLAGASRPFWNDDHMICVIGNCEVYNQRELLERLVGRAHYFANRSDSQVQVHVYERCGVDIQMRSTVA